jgi:hypothetical protein
LAAASLRAPRNFIWAATGNQPPAYTLDGGKTWTNINIPGKSDWSMVHIMPTIWIRQPSLLTGSSPTPSTSTTSYRRLPDHDGGVNWTKVLRPTDL